MQGITHYSFDLWFTLIRSNPQFKEERANYFHKNFALQTTPLEEVMRVFRQVDLMCNSINEKTGGNITSEEMYCMVIYLINDSLEAIHPSTLEELYTETENLIFQYMPVVFSDETYHTLDRLNSADGVTMNLLSNTAFIKGRTLRKILSELNLANYFQFELYSDELGMSKPNQRLFQLMFDQICALKKNEMIEKKHILHIGDNPIADIRGASTFGFQTFLLNTNDQLISDIP